MHRAVHGRRDCRRPCRAADGDNAGVSRDGTWPGGALCIVGGDARRWRARRRDRDAGWKCCARALAFPMYGASAWLVWVVSQEAGPPAYWAPPLGWCCLASPAGCWASRRAARTRPAHWPIGRHRRAAGGAGGAERNRGGTGRAVRCGGGRGGAVQCLSPCRAACRGAAGVRQHDRCLVRDVPGERASGDQQRRCASRVRQSSCGVHEG